MAGRYRMAGALVAAIALAGCGGSGSNSASTTSSTTSLSPAQAAKALVAVRARVLHAGELAGFHPASHPVVGAGANSWVEALGVPPEDKSNELERLEQEGFVAGILEQLAPTNGGHAKGLSVVQEFQTSEAASFELENQLKQLAKLGETPFTVTAIPGAHGYAQRSRINVEFAEGPYYYDVGARWPPGTSDPPSRAAVVAAAAALYKRVHQ